MPRENSKCRQWQKQRRNRLKEAFDALAKVLPHYEPSVNICQIEVLRQATSAIQELQEEVKKVVTSHTGDSSPKSDIIKKLHNRIKKLLLRNEQLSKLLQDAGISIPKTVGVFKFKKPFRWSNKISPEEAKLFVKGEIEKENSSNITTTGKSRNPKLTNSGNPKPSRKSDKGSARRRNTSKKLASSSCLFVVPQPVFRTNLNQSCYVISKPVSTCVPRNQQNKKVATQIKSIISTTFQPTVSQLGPGTLILKNGTVIPVITQSQVILPSPPSLVTNAINSAPIVSSKVMLDSKNEKNISARLNRLPLLKPNSCSTKTTQINKVPIPALTSKYANNQVLLQRKRDNKSQILKASKRKINSQDKTSIKKANIETDTNVQNIENNGEETPSQKEEVTADLSAEGDNNPVRDKNVNDEDKIENNHKETTSATNMVQNVENGLKSVENNTAYPINEPDNPHSNPPPSAQKVVSVPTTTQEIKNLDLNITQSDLSNDIFASLQQHGPGCQNPESTSPTAAFLLSFPLVSSIKTNEVIDDDNSRSQRGTPNLLNLDNFPLFSKDEHFYGSYGNLETSHTALEESCNNGMYIMSSRNETSINSNKREVDSMKNSHIEKSAINSCENIKTQQSAISNPSQDIIIHHDVVLKSSDFTSSSKNPESDEKDVPNRKCNIENYHNNDLRKDDDTNKTNNSNENNYNADKIVEKDNRNGTGADNIYPMFEQIKDRLGKGPDTHNNDQFKQQFKETNSSFSNSQSHADSFCEIKRRDLFNSIQNDKNSATNQKYDEDIKEPSKITVVAPNEVENQIKLNMANAESHPAVDAKTDLLSRKLDNSLDKLFNQENKTLVVSKISTENVDKCTNSLQLPKTDTKTSSINNADNHIRSHTNNLFDTNSFPAITELPAQNNTSVHQPSTNLSFGNASSSEMYQKSDMSLVRNEFVKHDASNVKELFNKNQTVEASHSNSSSYNVIQKNDSGNVDNTKNEILHYNQISEASSIPTSKYSNYLYCNNNTKPTQIERKQIVECIDNKTKGQTFNNTTASANNSQIAVPSNGSCIDNLYLNSYSAIPHPANIDFINNPTSKDKATTLVNEKENGQDYNLNARTETSEIAGNVMIVNNNSNNNAIKRNMTNDKNKHRFEGIDTSKSLTNTSTLKFTVENTIINNNHTSNVVSENKNELFKKIDSFNASIPNPSTNNMNTSAHYNFFQQDSSSVYKTALDIGKNENRNCHLFSNNLSKISVEQSNNVNLKNVPYNFMQNPTEDKLCKYSKHVPVPHYNPYDRYPNNTQNIASINNTYNSNNDRLYSIPNNNYVYYDNTTVQNVDGKYSNTITTPYSNNNQNTNIPNKSQENKFTEHSQYTNLNLHQQHTGKTLTNLQYGAYSESQNRSDGMIMNNMSLKNDKTHNTPQYGMYQEKTKDNSHKNANPYTNVSGNNNYNVSSNNRSMSYNDNHRSSHITRKSDDIHTTYDSSKTQNISENAAYNMFTEKTIVLTKNTKDTKINDNMHNHYNPFCDKQNINKDLSNKISNSKSVAYEFKDKQKEDVDGISSTAKCTDNQLPDQYMRESNQRSQCYFATPPFNSNTTYRNDIKVSTSSSYTKLNKNYPNSVYNNSTNYNYHADANFNQNYYKPPPVSRNEAKSYYSFNYDNYQEFKKPDSNKYYDNTAMYNSTKDKINTDKIKKSSHSKPVNWMTAPEHKPQTSECLMPTFSAQSFTFASTETDANTITEPRKPTDVPMITEEKQYSWSPTKLPNFLDPAHNIVTPTLPTLVGDLALGNSLSFTEQKIVKENKRKSVTVDNQTNFFSVSQLVDGKSETTPAKTTTRRNSGNRSKSNSGHTKNKRSCKNDSDNNGDKNSPKTNSEYNVENGNSDIFRSSNKTTSSYSAEALIGNQTSEMMAARKSTFPSSKTLGPSTFLTDNLVTYFPSVDDNYITQSHNFQTVPFSHNSFQNNTFSTNSFIYTAPTITSTYLSNTFETPTQHDYNTENFNSVPLKDNKSNTTNKSYKQSNKGDKHPTRKKKKPVIDGNTTGLTGFDLPFLPMPGSTNSPVLPDDFHSHTTFLPPPSTYPCKNSLYQKQPTEFGANSLLSMPVLPRNNIQHPEISPSMHSAGTSLTNFNLSAIFPEINKASTSNVYPGTESKEHSNTSTLQVPFNVEPKYSFSS